MEKIYFDNGSTSFPKAPGVAEKVADLLERGAFNINRGNYEGAYEVADCVLETREKLAELFHAKSSKQVIFTPGITYSINFFLKGLLKKGDHIITTSMEHNAVMRPLYQLEQEGVVCDIVQADEKGNVKPKDFEAKICPQTKAVIMLHASNVCGTVLPIEEVGTICKKHHIFFAVDTAQSAGTLDVDMEKCNIDFLAFTGHKGLLGPQGIGGFLISEALDKQLTPLIAGGTGSQSDLLAMPDYLPDKYESGTMNLPGIIGLHTALSYIEKIGLQKIHDEKMRLTKYFLEKLKEVPTIKIAGEPGMDNRVAVVALDFQDIDNSVAAFELEQNYGIMTRVGLHCAPMAHKTLGTYPEGVVRFAFGASNTTEEIDVCIRAFREILNL